MTHDTANLKFVKDKKDSDGGDHDDYIDDDNNAAADYDIDGFLPIKLDYKMQYC